MEQKANKPESRVRWNILMAKKALNKVSVTYDKEFINRELSWLNFAGRVLSLVEDGEMPLLERVKFAGIMGMLHDEFFMKRMSGLKRKIKNKTSSRSIDGRTPAEEFRDCRKTILEQSKRLAKVIETEIRPGLSKAGIPLINYNKLKKNQQSSLKTYFKKSVLPILTPLAVDAEHPFPFISNLGLNLAIELKKPKKQLFVRIKVPTNRSRWVPLDDGSGFVPLEQIIAANLDLLFPRWKKLKAHLFRLTRGAEGDDTNIRHAYESNGQLVPGSIISQVTNDLKARRFAGTVRLQVSSDMPKKMRTWLTKQLKANAQDIYETTSILGIADLLKFQVNDREQLRDPEHMPVVHPRLKNIGYDNPANIFREIRNGDILLHHPYHCFDTSVLAFIHAAAIDPKVLAIKLTIYRTSSDSPIVKTLLEAARRGKQVAVLVEITARFDEAPNIAWGRLLENEGVHVAYGVEQLKTHVKLALVVREEDDGIHRYVHVGTGNYHSQTAKIYEDLGMLTCDPDLSSDVAAVFNELTSATPYNEYRKLLVAPRYLRNRFHELIMREIKNKKAGKPAGIKAKMNQLQDPAIIKDLYAASKAGVPISLNVRGLCCLRPGVKKLSENIRVFSVLGRFLEHGRIFQFVNAGNPEYYIGSADWMKRNLDNRVETVAPVTDPTLQKELDNILKVYEDDNYSSWEMKPDGSYQRRKPNKNETPKPAQKVFIELT